MNPQVNIQMKEYHSLSFTISGAVSSPGEYELDFHPSLMDLIAKAGGVIKERRKYCLRAQKQPGIRKRPHTYQPFQASG